MGRGFGAGPAESDVLAHDELKRADERSFERGDIHFAVTLAGVAVADFKERAGRMNGNVQRRSCHEILVVQIAGLNPRRIATETSGSFRRSDTHAAKKRMQWNFDAGSEARNNVLFVERNNFHLRVRVVFGQKAAPGIESVVGIRNRKLRGENFHFEYIANFRAFDVDGSGKNVSAGSFVLNLIGDVAQRLLDLVRRNARIFEPLRAGSNQRLNLHSVAGLNAQHPRCLRIIVPPRYSFRRRLQYIGRRFARLLPPHCYYREECNRKRDQGSHFSPKTADLLARPVPRYTRLNVIFPQCNEIPCPGRQTNSSFFFLLLVFSQTGIYLQLGTTLSVRICNSDEPTSSGSVPRA